MTNDEIIYIDADEEITSVLDKLKQVSTTAILLVVPKGASLLQSVVNLKLLKKESDEEGKNIALVTTDPVGRNLAGQVGIPVYQDMEGRELVAQAPKPERPPLEDVIEVDMSSREPVDSKVSVHHYLGQQKQTAARPAVVGAQRVLLRRKILIGLGLVIVALAGVTILYPKTTVVLGVESESFSSAIELTIDKKATEASKNSSILPGTEIIVEKEKTATAQATGKRVVGEKAKGSVTVYNCYQSVPLAVQSGTTLTASGKSFVTTSAVTVPAATIVGPNCTAAGQADVNIEASSVGADLNLGANSTFCVSGYSCSGGTYVNAKNSTALQGGSSRDVTYLKQEDIDAASNTAKDELVSSATEELKTQAEDRELRVLEAAIDAQVVEKLSSSVAGAETNDAQVTTKVRVRTLAFREADYRQLIVDLLSLRLPGGKKLILSSEDEIATTVPESNWDEGYIKVKGDVKTRVVDEVDEGRVKSLIKNSSVGAAQSKLMELPGVVDVSVETTPRFLNRTALFVRNITVKQEAK